MTTSTKFGFEGYGGISVVTDGRKAPLKALPASWFLSEDMYQLERRAIFSRKWLLTTHQMRLKNVGDFLKFEVANYEFILAKDRQGNINAFHNICRHRAYPVVENCGGNAKIFACKYHGWSYSLDGKLAKPSRFEDMKEGFDKSQYGLFKIHTKVDEAGFVWVNLDSSEHPEPWDSEFNGLDTLDRFKGYNNFDDYVFDHEWQLDTEANWKLCSDNYNECYHCRTSHPTLQGAINIESIRAESVLGWTKHTTADAVDHQPKDLKILATYLFPNISSNVTPDFVMIQRFVPISAQRTIMHYQMFRNQKSPQENFDKINHLYKQVMAEDKELCVGAQSNLRRGVFINGAMHPRLESASLHVQAKIRDVISEHLEKEKEAGNQIWPALQRWSAEDTATEEDEALCAGLSTGCSSLAQETLAW